VQPLGEKRMGPQPTPLSFHFVSFAQPTLGGSPRGALRWTAVTLRVKKIGSTGSLKLPAAAEMSLGVRRNKPRTPRAFMRPSRSHLYGGSSSSRMSTEGPSRYGHPSLRWSCLCGLCGSQKATRGV
jgi:hypothetical protein